MVALNPSARADAVCCLLDGTRTQCVVRSDGRWFPAAISVCWSPSHSRPVHTVVRVRLLTGEPEAFFATGQPFTLWADAIVDDVSIRGEGLLGDGVITGDEPEVSPAISSDEAPGTTARPAPADRRMVPQPRPGVRASPIGGRR
jgi:hypothetical protein